MMPKTSPWSSPQTAMPQTVEVPRIVTNPYLKLRPIKVDRHEGRYRVRVGHQLFEGDDTKHLLKLAVRARRTQLDLKRLKAGSQPA